MALALRHSPAPAARPRPLLLYSRPLGDFAVQHAQLAQLVAHDARLDVETCSPLAAARRCRTWVSATQPTLLLVRAGEIVAIAVGRFPLRELEELIARSLR